jgi:alpha-L-fucosidase
VLLLNVPPDTDGRLHDTDVTRLREFRERIEHELPEDLARRARVTGSSRARTVDLGTEREVDRIRLAEDIRHGQQIESLVIEAYRGGAWREVSRAGTVGASRILLLAAPVRARRWRVRVTGARGAVRLKRFALYRSAV